MMAALLILLVALGALAVGVLVGRYYVPDDRMIKRQARHGRSYLRALTHHIARDHDTVIDELRRVVDDNVDDSEPYFALAALFRTRGEHERAIRVHQALAVREGASGKLRQRALYELGLDFRAAGMPRRAVKALEQVLAADAAHEGALRALCGLYEEQGRFAEAAAAWTRLGKLRGEPPPVRRHHLLCAAAQQAIAEGDLDSAKQLLRDARAVVESPHFFVAAAELAAARGNPKGARERLRQALLAAPELASYLVPGLATAEQQLLLAAGPAHADDELALAAPAVHAELPSAPATDPLALATVSDTGSVTGSGSGSDTVTGSGSDTVTGSVTGSDSATGSGSGSVTDSGSGSGSGSDTGPASDPAARALADTLVELATTSRSPHLALAAGTSLATIDPPAGRARLDAIATETPSYLPGRLESARLALAHDDPAAIRRELSSLVSALAWADGAAWRCRHCGQRGDRFAWRCGGCRRWATAAPEIGRDRAEPVRPPPRERRAERRTSSLALLGERADLALPSGGVEHGLTAAELSTRAQRRSVLGRVGGWISGAWSGVRGKKRA